MSPAAVPTAQCARTPPSLHPLLCPGSDLDAILMHVPAPSGSLPISLMICTLFIRVGVCFLVDKIYTRPDCQVPPE